MAADVAVLGGGVAGTVAAIRLARLGHRVVLVERGSIRPPLVRHVSPTAVRAFEALGLEEALAGGGLPAPTARLVRWHGPVTRVPEQGGVLVDRVHFEQRLRRLAADAGVDVRCGSARAPVRRSSGFEVPVDTAGGRSALDAAFVVDAAGRRSSLLGRRGPGRPHVALGAWWALASPAPCVPAVEKVDGGWCWLAPVGGTTAQVLTFPEGPAGSGSHVERDRLHESLARRGPLLRELLRGARRDGPVWVEDAQPHLAPPPGEPGSFRTGDAAVALDPLSSQGIQVAVRSALHTAAAVHTTLTGPDDAELAARFHLESHRRTWAWHERQRLAIAAGGAPSPSRGPGAPRLPAGARLAVGPEARWHVAAVLDGEVVRLRPALEHPDLEDPVAFVGSRLLAGLVDLLVARPLGEALDEARRDGWERPEAVAGWLLDLGALVAAEPGGPSEA